MAAPQGSRSRYVLAALAWCVVALALKPFYPYVDFGAFYSTAISSIVEGAPLEIYSFVARPPGTGLAIPLSYPPLYFFYLTPLYGLGQWLGIADFHHTAGFSLGQAWMLLATLPFDLLLAREVVLLVEKRRGPLDEPRRWLLFVCVLFSPLLWLSTVRYGHSEAMMFALLLAGIRKGEEGKTVASGLLWGLALSLKATAAIPALVFFGWGLARHRRRAIVSASLAGGMLLAQLLPYLLLRREQIWYALVGFEGLRPVGGYVLWKLASFPSFLPDLSGWVILTAALAIGLLLGRRGESGFLEAGGAMALVLSQVVLLILGKAVFVWYGLGLSVFAFVAFSFPAGDTKRLPLLPWGLSLLLWLIQSGPWVGTVVNPAVLARSALWVALLVAVGWMSARALSGRPYALTNRDGTADARSSP